MYGIRTIFNSDILCFFSSCCTNYLIIFFYLPIFSIRHRCAYLPCFSFKCFNVFNIWGIFSRTIFSGLSSIFPRFIFIWKMLMSMICPIYICFTFPRTYRDFALKNKSPCSACEFQAKQGISILGIKLLFFSV